MDKFVTKKRKVDDKEESKEETKKSKKSEEKTAGNSSFASIKEALTIPFDKFKTEDEYEDRMKQIAEFLLNEVVLMVNGKKHRFNELEFYITCKTHNDPFTHGDETQRTTANWYFHRSGNTYRSGTYKGLDLSIGKNDKEFGGILIRSIEDVENGKIICGPCKSVDHMLEVCKAPTIKDLVDSQMKKDLSVDNTKGPIYVMIDNSIPKREIFRSPRVGLNMKKANHAAELQMQYCFKLYRFITLPKKIPKGKAHMAVALYQTGKKPGEIVGLIGGTLPSIENFTKAYDAGKNMKGESFVNKKLEDTDVCSAFAALIKHIVKS